MTEFLHGVEVVEVDIAPRPIRALKSNVIGLVGTAPKGPVNVPTLIPGSRLEAFAKFGAGIGTIPDALDGIFDHGGFTVVVVNVLNPATHKVAVANAEYTFGDDGTFALPDPYPQSLVITNTGGGTTYDLGTDYTVNEDTGVVTRVAGGSIAAKASIKAAYNRLDETAVVNADVMGGVDPNTGAYSGVHALLGAATATKLIPKILIAPGYTSATVGSGPLTGAPVAAELATIADRLKATAIVDGPDTNDSEAKEYRALFGSRRVYIVDPHAMVWDAETDAPVASPASSRAAGIMAKSDAERGVWWSPSNREMFGIVGTHRPIDFAWGDKNTRANLLNAEDVATIIQLDGYRLWGNRTASSDPKWQFVSVVRSADALNEALLRSHLWAVDRAVGSGEYFKLVVEGVNAYIADRVAEGALVGGSCWASPDLNSVQAIQDGRSYFDFDFTPPYPSEHITFRSMLTGDYLEEILQ